MLFYILVAAVAVVAIVTFSWAAYQNKYNRRSYLHDIEGWGDVAAWTGTNALVAGMVALVIFGCMCAGASIGIGNSKVGHYHAEHSLTALKATEKTEGSYSHAFFIGSGYVDGVRKLNYIQNDHGVYTLKDVYASDARLIETSGTPHVTLDKDLYACAWLMPWGQIGGVSNSLNPMTYTFYIPKGSVLSDYTIKN